MYKSDKVMLCPPSPPSPIISSKYSNKLISKRTKYVSSWESQYFF